MNPVIQLPVPVLRTASLARSAAWYTGVLGFDTAQAVPGVFVLLRLQATRLQLWQSLHAAPQELRVPVEGDLSGVFDRVARTAGAWVRAAPAPTAWGTCEFRVADLDGNLLRFEQPIARPLVNQG